MVEINNQRKAFLDMLAWSEIELITDVRKPEISGDCHCRRRAFTDYPDHPGKLVTLNPNSNQRAGRYSASFPLVGCLPQAACLKDFLRKSGRCGIAAD